MNTSKPSMQRLSYIDGIRGLFCFMILACHYWGIYSMRQDSPDFLIPVLDAAASVPAIRFLMSGTVWLSGFLAISGYLAANSRTDSLFALGKRCLLRFLRLFLPVLGACTFIFLLHRTLGFHSIHTTVYFTNTSFQYAYWMELNLRDIWTESLRTLTDGFCNFNQPFWVIRDIFFSSLLIYVCNYADHWSLLLTKKRIPLAAAAVCWVLWKQGELYILVCLAGYFVGVFRDFIRKMPRWCLLGYFAAAAVILVYNWRIMRSWYMRPFEIVETKSFQILVWVTVLLLLERLPRVQKCLSAKPLLALGDLSFGIYAFHWPVSCSVGALALLWGFSRNCSHGVSFLMGFLATIGVTLVISLLYHKTIEAATSRITGSLNALLNQVWGHLTKKQEEVL